MQDIFLRTRMILGDAAMESLAGSHVAVFGLGGVAAMPWRLWLAPA